jgi:hypothetical protein
LRNARIQEILLLGDLHGSENARADFEEKQIQLTDETCIPCRVLRTAVEVGFVAPSAWDGFCKRRTSLYRKSEKAEKSLVVSNKPLDHLGVENPMIITESTFRPDRLPTDEEISQLIQSEEYQKRKPREWDDRGRCLIRNEREKICQFTNTVVRSVVK